MKKTGRRILFTLILGSALLSCNGEGKEGEALREGELTISGLSADKWTYFSFEKGEVVGQSEFLSDEENALWAERLDWDIAICGDYIKTNGGDSGKGMGGILRDRTSNFLTLEEAPADGYLVDEIRMVKK